MTRKIDFTKHLTPELVNYIGLLKAELAPLEKRLEEAVDELKSRGRGVFEGTLYDANVYEQTKQLLDMDAVRAKLTHQFIAANTRPSTSVICKVTAKQLKIAA